MELNRSTLTTLLEVVGAISIVVGVSLVSDAAAFIVAGTLLIAAGVRSA
jgi:hypothetical protein